MSNLVFHFNNKSESILIASKNTIEEDIEMCKKIMNEKSYVLDAHLKKAVINIRNLNFIEIW